ncbi:hypothetical protein BKA81DRAFT_11073 [Phyllosticta paracitricarpa]
MSAVSRQPDKDHSLLKLEMKIPDMDHVTRLGPGALYMYSCLCGCRPSVLDREGFHNREKFLFGADHKMSFKASIDSHIHQELPSEMDMPQGQYRRAPYTQGPSDGGAVLRIPSQFPLPWEWTMPSVFDEFSSRTTLPCRITNCVSADGWAEERVTAEIWCGMAQRAERDKVCKANLHDPTRHGGTEAH